MCAAFVSQLQVRPFGVLGTQLSEDGELLHTGAEPGLDVAIADPAGLPYIQELGPASASGASGSIYEWLAINEEDTFPQPVRDAITAPLMAKLHAYEGDVGPRSCIHVVGPNFSSGDLEDCSRAEAVNMLSQAYRALLAEFASSGLAGLRLLPLSGGIFAGPFRDEMPELTAEALGKGFDLLSAEEQGKVLGAKSLEICIFMARELQPFSEALEAAASS